MASQKSEGKLDKMLKCTFCEEILQEPKTLSCCHTFCQKCIKQLPKQTRGKFSGLKCPMCKAFTPDYAVRANLLVSELLEMHHKKRSGTDHLCGQCSEDKSAWKCIDCKTALCGKCKMIHFKIPYLKGHQVIPSHTGTDMRCDELVFCTKHTDQPIIFNCRDCEVLLCGKYKVTQHEFHKIETFEDTLERLIPEVRTCVDKVKEHIADIGENDDYLRTMIGDIRQKYNQCRQESKDNLEKVIKKAKDHHTTVVTALDTREDEELGKLEAWLNRKIEYEQLVEWVSACNQAAKGPLLLGEIQAGLFSRLQQISSSEKMTETAVTIDYPKLSCDNPKDKIENMTGKVTFKSTKLFKAGDSVVYGRTVSVPYTEIFSQPLVSQTYIPLNGECSRISIIKGNIWAPLPANNIIQVFDLDGKELPSIQFHKGPRSVKELPSGEIIVASDSGLFLLNPDGTRGTHVKGTSGAYSDFYTQGDVMVAVNYNQNRIVYCRRYEDTWSQQDIRKCIYNTNSPKDTVLMLGDTFLTHHSHCPRAITQYNDQLMCESHYHSESIRMSRPFLAGTDSTGNILIADKNRFLLFNPMDSQWQVVHNLFIPQNSNATDALCVDGSVWILSSQLNSLLIQYSQQHMTF